jgi:multidrug efflux pump subunit AcrA (membrane-fusion protein)
MPDHNLSRIEPESGAVQPPAPARRRRRGLVAGVLVLAALGVGVMLREDIAALLPRQATSPAVTAVAEPPPALTVAVAEAAPRPLARTVVGDGSVVAWQELVIGAEAGGLRVAEVAVEEGDAVRQGQLLVRLDDGLLRAALNGADAAVAEADAALRVARQELARAIELVRTGSATRQTVEQRESAAAQAEARLASAAARREEAAARLAQARILAPSDGTVSKRAALLGSVTSPGRKCCA